MTGGGAPPTGGTELDRANELFHVAYGRGRDAERRRGPVFVVLADELAVFRSDGSRTTVRVTPRAFHVIKSAAHVPVALFAAIERGDARLLRGLADHVARALESLRDEADVAPPTREIVRVVLADASAFLARVLAIDSNVSAAEVGAFARENGPRLLALTEHATRVQLDALHEAVERQLAALAPAERAHLQVVVTGDHQARVRSLGMQYFAHRFREREGDEERVAYAEGVDDAESALALVGTRRMDARIAEAFFGDRKRLQRDVLGDAVRDLLSTIAFEPIR